MKIRKCINAVLSEILYFHSFRCVASTRVSGPTKLDQDRSLQGQCQTNFFPASLANNYTWAETRKKTTAESITNTNIALHVMSCEKSYWISFGCLPSRVWQQQWNDFVASKPLWDSDKSSKLLLVLASTVLLAIASRPDPWSFVYFYSFKYLWVLEWGLFFDERRCLTTTGHPFGQRVTYRSKSSTGWLTTKLLLVSPTKWFSVPSPRGPITVFSLWRLWELSNCPLRNLMCLLLFYYCSF
jgi:hypothetical protein